MPNAKARNLSTQPSTSEALDDARRAGIREEVITGVRVLGVLAASEVGRTSLGQGGVPDVTVAARVVGLGGRLKSVRGRPRRQPLAAEEPER